MICESGHLEYDHNLEDYIDFKRYGDVKMSNETGTFTDKGYIIYQVNDERSLGEYVAKYKEHAGDEASKFIKTEN